VQSIATVRVTFQKRGPPKKAAGTKAQAALQAWRGARRCGELSRDFLRGEDGVGVDADGVFHAACVAARESGNYRDVARPGGLNYGFVAGFQA